MSVAVWLNYLNFKPCTYNKRLKKFFFKEDALGRENLSFKMRPCQKSQMATVLTQGFLGPPVVLRFAHTIRILRGAPGGWPAW